MLLVKIMLNGVDIAPKVGISSLVAVDGGGNAFDSVSVSFSDTEKKWSGRSPKMGDGLEIVFGGFSSGACFIDEIGQNNGIYSLGALSAPLGVKEKRSRSLENISLFALAGEVAGKIGFGFTPYEVKDVSYKRIDQNDKSDLGILKEKCALEGVSVKFANKKLVLFSEAAFEGNPPALTLTPADFLESPDFLTEKIRFSACLVSFGKISGEYRHSGEGETLYEETFCTTCGEAQRFAKGLLRQENKEKSTLWGKIALCEKIAGGSTIKIADFGTADGNYFVKSVRHNILEGFSELDLRKCLEGY